MKLVGILRGGSFYPKMIKNVLPTKHKYDANVTWSAHTDTYKPTLTGHGIDAEINAFKYNLQLTILISPTTDTIYEKEINDVLETGRMGAGLYFRTMYPIQEQVDFFEDVVGRGASYWSYGNGIRDHDAFVTANGLISRLSHSGEYSYDFSDRLGHKVSSLFNYDIRDKGQEQALIYAETNLTNAIIEEGWFNDFSHWHWAEQHGDINQLEQFFSSQRAILDTTSSVALSAGEAVEYMWLRKLYKRGGIFQDGDELVLISDVRNEVSLPFKSIITSLSVRVDVSGTTLEGRDIDADADVFKKDDNLFVVQVPYSRRDGFRAVRLRATSTPSYLDLSPPQILSVTKTGSKVTVITDKPTNVVLFSVPSGGMLYQASVLNRSNILSTTHEIDVGTTIGLDVYVGAITKEKQSVLSAKYTL